MEVKINVDDAKFNELFEKELDALTKEDVHHVYEECVSEYFRRNDYEKIQNLIFYKRNSWDPEIPTEFARQIIKQCDFSKMQDVVDICIEKLKTDHMEILKQIIGDAIIEGLTNTFHIRESIESTVRNTIYNMQMEQQNNMR